ncbi:sensor histidine kinase [Roseivirga seohaensis]|uniref:sensor histidine kinase n=1 Tax=Roseivirga seohaensis TaxID=1914963 RepID=UPI003BAC788B
MKNTYIVKSIVISLFLLAVMVAIIIFINQGDFVINQAIKVGKSPEEAKAILVNSIIAKGISVLLLVALFCFGSIISKKSIDKSRVRFLPFLFVIYAILYGGLCALVHEFLNPFFELSLLRSNSNDFQIFKTIPPLLYYSIIGLATLFASSTFSLLTINDSKGKGINIYSLGSRFWFVNYFLNFLIISVIYFFGVEVNNSSFGFIIIIFNLLIVTLTSSFVGSFILSSVFEKGKLVFNNLVERLAFGFISSFGTYSFVAVLVIIAFGLDSSFLAALGEAPAFLLRLLLFSAISGTIAILVWKFNVAGVRTQLQIASSESELSLLKSQINPHFLFNSLNTVYGLALKEESPKTAHAVQQLSEMMRFMLHENHAEKIPLQKEIDYLRNYIELQTLRISQKDHFQLEVDVAEGCQGEITPMVLIPFVENAFKHGVSFQKPSWVKIKLTCNAEEVHLNVQNSVHKHAEDPEKGKSGIGLENVRKRLGILYPEKHLFQIYETEDSFEANIKITLI